MVGRRRGDPSNLIRVMPAKGRTIPSTTRPDHVLQYDSEMSQSLRRMDMSSSNLMAGQADPTPVACVAALASFELVRCALALFAPVSFALGGFAKFHAL
jgi:hypothetical protein